MRNTTEHTSERMHIVSKTAFLLLSLPFSIIYFTLVITGVLLGIGTLVIWIGLPILLASLAMLWGFCALERQMIGTMLHMPIAEYPPVVGPMTLRKHFARYLRSGRTWKGLLYMLFIKMPLSIFNFAVVVALLAAALIEVLLPLAYLVTNNILQNIRMEGGNPPNIDYNMGLVLVVANGHFDPVMFTHSLIGIPVGLALFFLARYAINALAHVSGLIGRIMLGPSTREMTLPKEDLYNSYQAQGYVAQDMPGRERAQGGERTYHTQQIGYSHPLAQ